MFRVLCQYLGKVPLSTTTMLKNKCQYVINLRMAVEFTEEVVHYHQEIRPRIPRNVPDNGATLALKTNGVLSSAKLRMIP